MPKTFLVTRSAGGSKKYTCEVCREEIVPGEQYYHWKFYRGATHWQHAKHGAPKRSKTTTSKMGTVYDAVDDFDVSVAGSVEDIQQALNDVAQTAHDVSQEYGDAADNIESAFPSGNPTSEACRTISDELESWADSLESWEPDSDEPEDDEDAHADWLETCRSEAQELVNEQPEYQG